MSLLDDDFVNIPLHYYYKEGKYGSKQLIVLEDEKAAEMLEDDNAKGNIEILNTKWKKMSWKEENDLMKACEKDGDSGEGPSFDYSKYQDKRVKTMLSWWDLKAKENDPEPLPVSPENVDKMPSAVIRSLLEKFDATNNISEESLGK